MKLHASTVLSMIAAMAIGYVSCKVANPPNLSGSLQRHDYQGQAQYSALNRLWPIQFKTCLDGTLYAWFTDAMSYDTCKLLSGLTGLQLADVANNYLPKITSCFPQPFWDGNVNGVAFGIPLISGQPGYAVPSPNGQQATCLLQFSEPFVPTCFPGPGLLLTTDTMVGAGDLCAQFGQNQLGLEFIGVVDKQLGLNQADFVVANQSFVELQFVALALENNNLKSMNKQEEIFLESAVFHEPERVYIGIPEIKVEPYYNDHFVALETAGILLEAETSAGPLKYCNDTLNGGVVLYYTEYPSHPNLKNYGGSKLLIRVEYYVEVVVEEDQEVKFEKDGVKVTIRGKCDGKNDVSVRICTCGKTYEAEAKDILPLEKAQPEGLIYGVGLLACAQNN